MTQLARACEFGRLARVVALLKRGADVNEPGEYGQTPLFWAASWNRPHVVTVLLAHDADPNRQNDYDATPLSIVAQKGYVEIAKKLLNAGANIDHVGEHQLRPIHYAIIHGRTSMVSLLIERGANLAADKNDYTAFDHAVLHGNRQVINMMCAIPDGAPGRLAMTYLRNQSLVLASVLPSLSPARKRVASSLDRESHSDDAPSPGQTIPPCARA